MGMNQGGAPQRGGGYTPVGPRGGGTRTIGGGGTQPDTPGDGGGVAMPAPSYNEQPIKMPVVQPPVTATDARATAPLPMGGGMTVPGFGGAPTVIPPGSGPGGYSPGAGLGQGPYPYTGPSGVNMVAGGAPPPTEGGRYATGLPPGYTPPAWSPATPPPTPVDPGYKMDYPYPNPVYTTGGAAPPVWSEGTGPGRGGPWRVPPPPTKPGMSGGSIGAYGPKGGVTPNLGGAPLTNPGMTMPGGTMQPRLGKPSYGFPQLPGPNNPTTRYPGR